MPSRGADTSLPIVVGKLRVRPYATVLLYNYTTAFVE